jgi:hypothetical protein
MKVDIPAAVQILLADPAAVERLLEEDERNIPEGHAEPDDVSPHLAFLAATDSAIVLVLDQRDLARRQLTCNAPGEPLIVVDDSAWVIASTLWLGKIKTRRKLEKFREDHPDMFDNPSRNILKIHSGKWAAYWAAHGKAGFESLEADNLAIQEEALQGVEQRKLAARAKKQAGKQ